MVKSCINSKTLGLEFQQRGIERWDRHNMRFNLEIEDKIHEWGTRRSKAHIIFLQILHLPISVSHRN